MLATEAALRQVDLTSRRPDSLPPRHARCSAITLPLVAPAIGGAALIVFVLAIAEFGVPALLRVRVYTTEVFTAFAALFDFARATALTLPLLMLRWHQRVCRLAARSRVVAAIAAPAQQLPLLFRHGDSLLRYSRSWCSLWQ